MENKTQTFEEYLQEIHQKNYAGTDDDAPERFESWYEELSPRDIKLLLQQYLIKINKKK